MTRCLTGSDGSAEGRSRASEYCRHLRDLSPGPSCVPTMFDLNADGSCDDRCEACGSGPYHCWRYLQMMRVGCCDCSHWDDAVLAREVFYDWEELSEDRCKCRKCEAWRKRRDSCPCENCR